MAFDNNTAHPPRTAERDITGNRQEPLLGGGQAKMLLAFACHFLQRLTYQNQVDDFAGGLGCVREDGA